MHQRFDLKNAPQTPQSAPLRAERRLPAGPGEAVSISGVTDTPSGLIRSTLIAAGAAGAILILAYLPAEYGIDPTGVGGLLGLTEMGDIKAQLASENAADAAAATPVAAPAVLATDPGLLARLTAIEAQLAGIAAVIGAEPAPAVQPAPEPAPEVAAELSAAPTDATASGWRDEVSYTLPPGEGVEIKLVMQEGEVSRFEWTANGGVLNFETHGDDGASNNVSYEQGRATPEQSGELTAAFTGNHGWFWRNRTEEPVTLTLRTSGDYAEMKAP